MLRLIQPAEVLEHHAPLLRRESAQLVPRRVTNSWACAGRPRQQRGGDVGAVGRSCRAAGAALLLRPLLPRGASGGLPQPLVEPLPPPQSRGGRAARPLASRPLPG